MGSVARDITLSDLLYAISRNCEQAVAQEAYRVADEIRNTTPANRVETRKAVRVRRSGLQAEVLLQFPRQYDSTNTVTHKRFATQWKRIRPESQRRLIAALNDAIQTAATEH